MGSTDEFVLDGSVSLAWYFKDELNNYANAVRERLDHSRAVVPALWPLEIANAVLMGERRKRSTQAQAATWLGILAAFPVVIDDQTQSRAWSDTLSIARVHNL